MSYPHIYHLGIPKTGTTTIQKILSEDMRINYINNRFFNSPDWWLKTNDFIKPDAINVYSEENTVLQSGNFGKFILTLSHIQKVSPNSKIVLTIREQRKMLESRYKYCFPYYAGHHYEFDEWLTSGQGMDYLSIAMYYNMYKCVTGFFPAENVYFLLFEEMKNDFKNFLFSYYNIIGLDLPENVDFKTKENVSLSEPELLTIKKMNRFKILRNKTERGIKEEFYIKRKAEKFKDPDSQYDTFKWGVAGIPLFKSIEADFMIENNNLLKNNIFPVEKLKKYKYLI